MYIKGFIYNKLIKKKKLSIYLFQFDQLNKNVNLTWLKRVVASEFQVETHFGTILVVFS